MTSAALCVNPRARGWGPQQRPDVACFFDVLHRLRAEGAIVVSVSHFPELDVIASVVIERLRRVADVSALGRRVAVLALLGATFGTLFDYAHVRTGAIVYPGPPRFGVPWWVPLLYTGASLSIGLSAPVADTLLGRRARFAETPARLAAGFVGLCAVWFASGALPLGSGLVAVILAAASLGMWWGLDRTWQGLAEAAATAVGGCAVELTLSRAGLFQHTHQDVLGLAWWLPWIYVAASVGLGNVGRRLAR